MNNKKLSKIKDIISSKDYLRLLDWLWNKSSMFVFYRAKKRSMIQYLKNEFSSANKRKVMFVGFMGVDRKASFMKTLEKIAEENSDLSFVVLDESYQIGNRYWNNSIKRFQIHSFARPEFLSAGDKDLLKELLVNDETFKNATLSCAEKFGFSSKKAEKWVFRCFKFWNSVFDSCKPDLLVLWNEFSANHMICESLCRKNNTKIIYTEFGVLPGTVSIDELGQMGESFPAVEAEKFEAQAVSQEDLDQAQNVWDYLFESGLNRNKQVNDDSLDRFLDSLKPDRPVLLFAGNYDCDSGIVPYTEKAKKFHSPFFNSSEKAMLYLSQLAKKNDWNLIYKPHPMFVEHIDADSIPSNVHYCTKGNLNTMIDKSDVVITLMSQTAYISSIRKKATVMLGYNQLKDKGVVYQPDDIDDIESCIIEALSVSFNETKEDALRKHIAQLNKYYLFDDNSMRPLRYGQSYEAMTRLICGTNI